MALVAALSVTRERPAYVANSAHPPLGRRRSKPDATTSDQMTGN
jgi:hypothetical protein